MSILITKENAARYARELDTAHRFRHDFFVEGLGWEALRRPDGREIDDFDTDDAAHVIEIEDGRPIFYSRFIPTTKPHLLSHVYPELLQGQPAPCGPRTWELSRVTVLTRKKLNGRIDPATIRSALSTVEAALFLNATHLVCETHPGFMTRCFEFGYRPRPVAPIIEAYGQLLLVLELTVDDQTLRSIRGYFDHFAPVVTYNDRPALDYVQRHAA